MTMDCSELIEQLKNIRFYTADNGMKVEAICKAAAAELERAIQALRDQKTPLDRSRWEGCDYCAHNEDNIELCPMLSHDESDFDRGMYIHGGCLISNSGEFQYTEIKFCPKCGRPLNEEAWAEMDRRINGNSEP